MIRPIIMALCMSAAVSLPAAGKIERSVHNNVLISDKYPACRIKFSSDLTYLGTKEYEQPISDKNSTNTLITDEYYFAKSDSSNNVTALLVISFLNFRRNNWNFFNDLHSRVDANNMIEMDKVKFGDYNYSYVTAHFNSVNGDAKSYLKRLQLNAGNNILSKVYWGVVSMKDDRKVTIDYSEPVPPALAPSEWTKPDLYTDDQKVFVREFLGRANTAFQIIE